MENRIIRRFTKKVYRTFKFYDRGTLHVHVLFENLSTADFHYPSSSSEQIDPVNCKAAFIEPGDKVTMEFQSDTFDLKIIDVTFADQPIGFEVQTHEVNEQ